MGKEGELWDDSVLIQAFDDAMSNYKKMHGKNKNKNNGSSVNGQSVTSNVSALEPADHAGVSERGENSIASKTKSKMTENKNLALIEENPALDSHAPEPYVDSSNGLSTRDALKGYTYSQGPEDYNKLLSQYYELEEKKQQILQQLHQFGSWNYQCSTEGFGSGSQWGTCSTSQEHPVPASQTSHPTVVCSCCPYVCQSLLFPCTTSPACSLGGACHGKTCTDTCAVMGSGKSPSLVDGDIVNTAMGAVERALSSLKTNEGTEKKEEDGEEIAQTNSSGTDLTVVLNAWYSAGFYTGKYLTEQSIVKK